MSLADSSFRGRSDAGAFRHPASRADVRVPALVLVYLIALFTPMAFSIGPLAMNPLRLLLLVMSPVLFINLLIGRYGPLRLTDGLFFFYMIWATIALAINSPEMVVETAGSTSMEYLGGYLVARAAIRDRASFAGLCKVFGFIVALTIFPVLWEEMTGKAIIMQIVDAIPGVRSIGDGYFVRSGLQRVQVVFSHPILYGLVCSTAIPMTYVALKGEMSDTRRLLKTAIVATCTFFALSSGALLAMLLQFFMIGWAWAFQRTTYRWLILLILVILAYITIDLLSNRTPMRVFLTYATFSAQTAYTRLYIFEWGMVNVWANPFFGLGFKDWVRPSFMGSSVDNFWLLTTMRFGIPAFLSLASGYFLLIWAVGRRNFDGDTQMLRYRRAWVFTLVGMCFTLTTVHVWSGPYSFMAFLLGAGVWFLAAEPETNATPDAMREAPGVDDRLSHGPMYARQLPSDRAARIPEPERPNNAPMRNPYARSPDRMR